MGLPFGVGRLVGIFFCIYLEETFYTFSYAYASESKHLISATTILSPWEWISSLWWSLIIPAIYFRPFSVIILTMS